MEEKRTPSYYDNIFSFSSNGQDEEEEEDGNGMNQNAVVPYVGQLFESRKWLERFLDRYGKSMGFQWRTRSSRKNSRSGDVCGARYVCSKHGMHKPRGVRMNCPEPSTRVGCDASITTSMQKNGEWKINKLILEHNHDNDPCSSGFLRRYRHVPSHIKYRLMTNQRSGIGVRKTYSSLVVENQGIENLGVLERDCRNYVGAERRQTLGGGDAEAAMDYFGRMQTENPDFFYLPQIDKEGRLQNIFWADARSRAAYTEFGDVVSFDTTYKKNKYDMPFAPFVGVNHHGETILFGCALLLHEDIESFN